MKRIELPKEILEEKYFNNLKTLSEIAADFGVSKCCVRANFERCGISVRDKYETRHLRYKYSGKFPLDETILTKKYSIEEKDVMEIAIEIGCSVAWIYYMIHKYEIPINKKDSIKKVIGNILENRKYITTNRNISQYGYRKLYTRNENQVWILSSLYKHYLKKSHGSYQKYKEYHKTYDQSERGKERARRYRQTSKGKMMMAKQHARKRERGFIPLTEPLNEEFEWHHMSSNLSYVIAIPKEIHHSVAGNSLEDHYSTINGKWLIWGATHPEAKFKKK